MLKSCRHTLQLEEHLDNVSLVHLFQIIKIYLGKKGDYIGWSESSIATIIYSWNDSNMKFSPDDRLCSLTVLLKVWPNVNGFVRCVG